MKIKNKKLNTWLVLIICFVFLNSFANKVENVSDKYNESTYYKNAMMSLKSNKIKEAVEKFQKVNEMYPFSYWGKRAQMISAFVSYLNEDYKSASLFASSYLKTYPDGEDLEYMQYLRAESYFMQIKNIDNNLSYLELSKLGFESIIQNERSEYFKASSRKLKEINDLIAAKILSVGIFYQKSMNYHSAIARFHELVNNYGETKYGEEAIFRLIESYKALNLYKETKKYHSILEKRNSKWLKYL